MGLQPIFKIKYGAVKRLVSMAYVFFIFLTAILLTYTAKTIIIDLPTSEIDKKAITYIGEWLFLQDTKIGRIFSILSLANVFASISLLLCNENKIRTKIIFSIILLTTPTLLAIMFILRIQPAA